MPWQEGFGGEEARLESSGRVPISPGALWLPKPPEVQLCPVLCCFLGLFGCPSVKSKMKTSRNSGECWALGRSSPFPAPSISQGQPRAAVPEPSAPRSLQNGLKHPPKQSSTEKPPPNTDPQRGAAQGLKAIFPPGKEHGPGSWGSQKMSLSSTLSPTGRPRCRSRRSARVWGSLCTSRGSLPGPGFGLRALGSARQSRECALGSLKG